MFNGNDWENVIGGLVNAPNGGYLVTFGSGPEPFMGRNRILKLSSNGDIEWQNMRSSPNKKNPIRIRDLEVSTGSNSYIFVGCEVEGDRIMYLHVSEMDLHGNFIFSRCYYKDDDSIARYHAGNCISMTKDGGFIVAGDSYIEYLDDWSHKLAFCLTKFSSQGDVQWDSIFMGKSEGQWQKKYIRYFITALEALDKGYVFLADTPLFSVGNLGFLLIKLDENGNLVWQKTYGGPGDDDFFSMGKKMQLTPRGGYIITGTTDSFGAGGSDIWILEVDATGNILWQKTYGAQGEDTSSSIIVVQDGYIITGTSNSFGFGDSDMVALKISFDGDIQWQRLIGNSFYEEGGRCIQTKEGGFLFAGRSFQNSDSATYFLLIANLNKDGHAARGCASIKDSNFIVADTFVEPEIVNITPIDPTGLTPGSSAFENRTPSNISANYICWNLHNAPLNAILEYGLNQSLFVEEHHNTITWDRNPVNDNFEIVEYRIYRINLDSSTDYYKFVGAVPVGTYSYSESYSGEKINYGYSVASVDVNGVESPHAYAIEKGN
jgi:hypothetical protein